MKKNSEDYYDKKIDNELKKRELEEKYNARFSRSSELPPEIENQWLNSVEEFEKQHCNSKLTTVWEYIGRPEYKTKDELKLHEISQELGRLFDVMENNNVALITLSEVDDVDLYRFVTEELFQEQIEDIRIPEMTSCFIYEEYHPNN